MAIAKMASRNVAFKVARMRECIMEGQDELTISKSDSEEGGLEVGRRYNQAVLDLDDLGYNADLYIANQNKKSLYWWLDGWTAFHASLSSLYRFY